jgi:galactosamine-6-phosphate isomerase
MNKKIFQTEQEMGRSIADDICALTAEKESPLICLAAGHSSLPVFRALAERREHGFDFSAYYFVAMDEWAGMSWIDEESCGGFLDKNLLKPLGFQYDHIRLFDGRASDPKAECESVEQFIEDRGGIDFILLGIGMNGHLALNEPGCGINTGARFTELSETTRQIGQKYFSRPVSLFGGLTLGLKNIMAARSIIVNATGTHKAAVVRRLRDSLTADANFPVSALKDLPHARFYFDAACAEI